eukprot:4929479-Heterocapsa_arctica.AAC.1
MIAATCVAVGPRQLKIPAPHARIRPHGSPILEIVDANDLCHAAVCEGLCRGASRDLNRKGPRPKHIPS